MGTKCLVFLFSLITLGVCDDKISQRVIDGQLAKLKEFPFVVSLRAEPIKSHCTGSIITEKWVITAAHCYRGFNLKKLWTIVIAGTVDRDVSTNHTQERTSIRHIVHPYGPKRGKKDANFDLTLIEVDKPFTFNKYVNSITIAKSPFPHINDLPCKSMGYGRAYSNAHDLLTASRGYGQNSRLYFIPTKAGDYEHCYEESPRGKWTKELLCVDPVNPGTATCNGDSGGPLYCKGLLTGTLVGRRGPNPYVGAQPCATDTNFQMYMFTGYFETWIRSYVDNLPAFQPLSIKDVTEGRSDMKSGSSEVGVNVVAVVSLVMIAVSLE